MNRRLLIILLAILTFLYLYGLIRAPRISVKSIECGTMYLYKPWIFGKERGCFIPVEIDSLKNQWLEVAKKDPEYFSCQGYQNFLWESFEEVSKRGQ